MSRRSKRIFFSAPSQRGKTTSRKYSEFIGKVEKPELFYENRKKTDNWIN